MKEEYSTFAGISPVRARFALTDPRGEKLAAALAGLPVNGFVSLPKLRIEVARLGVMLTESSDEDNDFEIRPKLRIDDDF